MKLRAYLLMTFVVAVWGSTFVLIKGALTDATPAAFNLIRMTLAFVLLAVAYHRSWHTHPPHPHSPLARSSDSASPPATSSRPSASSAPHPPNPHSSPD